MKKTFPVIIGLITLSLAGIIAVQLLWLNNMLMLRKEQVRHKISDATTLVGNDLMQRKGSYYSQNAKSPFEIFLKPPTIGQRFTVSEIEDMIARAFKSLDLDKVKFEFAIISLDPTTVGGYFEKQSQNFSKVYSEDNPKNYNFKFPLNAPSGSESENLSLSELFVVVVPDYESVVYQSMRLPIFIAIFLSIIIITAFYLTVSTMLRQKKLSEIKNDFINNMTHEFKTPIATISLAVDALKNEKVMNDRTKMTYFSSIIKEENQRMNRQVETILKAALLDKQEVQLILRPVHAHDIIKNVAGNFSLQLEEKHGSAELFLNATNDYIDADEVHFSNLIINLIDNAIKYAKDDQPPFIKITTESIAKNLVIKIEDNGIGMTKETVKRIFEKFYRAHTGNLHNVKGFGLGLSYVKTMVEAHGGEITVESVVGKGSTFLIEIPLKKTEDITQASASSVTTIV